MLLKQKDINIRFIANLINFDKTGYLQIRMFTDDVYENETFDIGYIRLREDGSLFYVDVEGFAHFEQELYNMMDTKDALKYPEVKTLYNEYIAKLNAYRSVEFIQVAADFLHNTPFKATNAQQLTMDEAAIVTSAVKYDVAGFFEKYGIDGQIHSEPKQFKDDMLELLVTKLNFDDSILIQEPSTDKKGFIRFELTNRNRFKTTYVLDLELK